jgi:hypothetical protein
MSKLSEESHNFLCNQLVRVADILEGCDEGSKEHKEYSREYRRIAKILFPESYKKPLKPRNSKQFKQSITQCLCGSRNLKMKTETSGITIHCPACFKTSSIESDKFLARDSWNNVNK